MALPIRPATLIQTKDGYAYLAAASVEAGSVFHSGAARIDNLYQGNRPLEYDAKVSAAGDGIAYPDSDDRKVDDLDVVTVVRPFSVNGSVHIIADPEEISDVSEVDNVVRRFELLQLWTINDEGAIVSPVSGFRLRTTNLGKAPTAEEMPELLEKGLADPVDWDSLAKVGSKKRRRVQFHWLGSGLYAFLFPCAREDAGDDPREAMGRLVRFDALSVDSSVELDRKLRGKDQAPSRYEISRRPSNDAFVFRLLGKGGAPVFCMDDGNPYLDADGKACDGIRFGESTEEADVIDPNAVSYISYAKKSDGGKKQKDGVKVKMGGTAIKGKTAATSETPAPEAETSEEPEGEGAAAEEQEEASTDEHTEPNGDGGNDDNGDREEAA